MWEWRSIGMEGCQGGRYQGRTYDRAWNGAASVGSPPVPFWSVHHGVTAVRYADGPLWRAVRVLYWCSGAGASGGGGWARGGVYAVNLSKYHVFLGVLCVGVVGGVYLGYVWDSYGDERGYDRWSYGGRPDCSD